MDVMNSSGTSLNPTSVRLENWGCTTRLQRAEVTNSTPESDGNAVDTSSVVTVTDSNATWFMIINASIRPIPSFCSWWMQTVSSFRPEKPNSFKPVWSSAFERIEEREVLDTFRSVKRCKRGWGLWNIVFKTKLAHSSRAVSDDMTLRFWIYNCLATPAKLDSSCIAPALEAHHLIVYGHLVHWERHLVSLSKLLLHLWISLDSPEALCRSSTQGWTSSSVW